MKSEPQTFTLPNGLRVVHLHIPGAAVAHFGVAVAAGSSDENSAQHGLAHFVEHTLFKGTRRRSAWHILNRMEAVGGELGAFTTKQDTVVYSTFPAAELSRAVDLIADLILNSQFPQKQIDNERQVICDEINSYLDTPSEAVYDHFEDLLYQGSSFGHNILGSIQSVNSIDSQDCRGWLDRYYTAHNMVVYYAGRTSLYSLEKHIISHLDSIPKGQTHSASAQPFTPRSAFVRTKTTDTRQAHTVMGCALPRLSDQERIALALVTNILGGPGMNSLLNLSLRERSGLVYNVESNLTNWRNTTMFTTYFGTDPEDNTRCVSLVLAEIDRLASGYMTPRRVAAARKQYHGQMIVARANAESRIMAAARSLLHRGRLYTAADIDDLLASVSPTMIADLTGRLPELSRLTYCP